MSHTERDIAIIRAIDSHQQAFGHAPTYRMIADKCRIPLHCVATAIPRLERGGMVRRPWPDSARCIEILVTLEQVR